MQASQLTALNISRWQENLSYWSKESFQCFVCQMTLCAFFIWQLTVRCV